MVPRLAMIVLGAVPAVSRADFGISNPLLRGSGPELVQQVGGFIRSRTLYDYFSDDFIFIVLFCWLKIETRYTLVGKSTCQVRGMIYPSALVVCAYAHLVSGV